MNTILDKGTTGLAAKNLSRNYIMIENDETYYKTCINRVGENIIMADMHEPSIKTGT